MADNLHYYERHDKMVHQLAEIHDVEDRPLLLKKTFGSLEEFDDLITMLGTEEQKMRMNTDYKPIEIEDSFFANWYQRLYEVESIV